MYKRLEPVRFLETTNEGCRHVPDTPFYILGVNLKGVDNKRIEINYLNWGGTRELQSSTNCLDLNYTDVNGAAVELQSNHIITYKHTIDKLKLLYSMYHQNTVFYRLYKRCWNKKNIFHEYRYLIK